MLKTATSIIFALAFLLCQSKVLTANVFADKDSILLTLENSSFVPLSNVHGNQVTMSVKYQVNDESLEGEKVNGIMKLYSTNGSLIHSSSFPDGFTAKKKGGTEDFKTTIRDPTIQSLTANVTFTDLKKTETVSNVLTTNLQLKNLSVPVATPDLDDSTTIEGPIDFD
jgi:hypothetical protein